MANELPRGEELDLRSLKHLLSAARVKGRSRAKTREQAEHLCALHGLLAVAADSSERELLPPDMLHEVCDSVVSGAVQSLREVLREANAAEQHGWQARAASAGRRLSDARERAKFARTIMKRADETVQTLLSLRLTSRFIAPILYPDSAHWWALLETFHRCSQLHARDVASAVQHAREGRLSAMRACVLVTTTGCEACGAARIRKVQWPFGARFCDSCLKELTTSDFRIRERYRVTGDQLRAHGLPCVAAELFTPRVGGYTLHFYLNTHVLRLLRHLHGFPFASLEEAYSYVNREALAYSRAVAQRNEDMFHVVVADSNGSGSVSGNGNGDRSPRDVQELRDVSQIFDMACRRPLNYAPHIGCGGERFRDVVVQQWTQHLADRSRQQWQQDVERFARDVARPFVRALLRDRADVSTESAGEEEEGLVGWLLERIWERADLPASLPGQDGGGTDGITRRAASASAPVPAGASFDGERARRAFWRAAEECEDMPAVFDRARKLFLIVRILRSSEMGKQLTTVMMNSNSFVNRIPGGAWSTSQYEKKELLRRGAETRIAESVLSTHGPHYEPPLPLHVHVHGADGGGVDVDATNAMLFAALPAVDPIFPRGVQIDAHTKRLACPCGRRGLPSLKSLTDHLKGAHRVPLSTQF